MSSSTAIAVKNIGKKYLIRHKAVRGVKNYRTLRDVVQETLMAPLRRLKAAGGSSSPMGSDLRGSPMEEFWALKDVSFEVKPGESVGIIGRNGAGKSTLLKLLSRITEPTTGRIELDGRVSSLLEVGTGFHPELTGRENIYLNGSILGMSRHEIRARFDEIVAFAEVERFLDTPVKRYSSGMYVRLAFAVAAHLEPDILIVDEVLAVGDAEFQKKCVGKMQSVAHNEGRTVLFVSHNLQTVRQMCDRVILLKKGQVAFDGEPHAGINSYLNQSAENHSNVIDLTTYPRQQERDGAEFLSIRFLDEAGQPAGRVPWASDLTVEVRFRTSRPLKQLDIPMGVTHAEGLRIFSETYSDQFSKLDLSPGEYVLRFAIPLRFLKLESYFLGIGLYDAGRHCDFVEGLPFPEFIDENADPHMESHRWGVVRIPLTWNTLETIQGAVKPV
ncbi:ABC transporter ATP-binding protein [soil metagenome]